MRDTIRELISNLNIITFKISKELPFSNSGVPLYSKNPKWIYIDNPQVQIVPDIKCLNGLNINSELSTIGIFFACDAKQLPSDYQQLVTNISNIKDDPTFNNYYIRECSVKTGFDGDMMTTQIDLAFTQLK